MIVHISAADGKRIALRSSSSLGPQASRLPRVMQARVILLSAHDNSGEARSFPGSFAAISACVIFIGAKGVEGSHNGSAAVLKTAVRKDMQVRVLSPPPIL